jgi:hypothetical protein
MRADARQPGGVVIGVEFFDRRISKHIGTESGDDTSSYHDPLRLFEGANVG